MRWTQLAVITFIAIQQTFCQMQREYPVPVSEMEAQLPSNYELEPNLSHRHFSTLYNIGKHPRKMIKVIKINDENSKEIHLNKRQERPLSKRSKTKGALLVAGGAAVGALAMKHFSKPKGGGSVAPSDPNAGGV